MRSSPSWSARCRCSSRSSWRRRASVSVADSTMTARLIAAARRGDVPALQALANMGEQMSRVSGDMAQLAARFRVLVNGELWNEVPSLFGQPPAAPVYTARQADAYPMTAARGREDQ